MTIPIRPVVITLHGIRTRGEWQKQIAPRIARYGMIPVLLDYGYFSIFKFLNPWSRNSRVLWLRDKVAEVVRDYPGAPISIVAHSMGTFLVARLIQDEKAFNFETVLFSGSIVEEGFNWVDPLNTNRVMYVANYRAKADIWPKMASWFVAGAGRAGIDGFTDKHLSLFQHTHPTYGHSDYFNPHVFEELWLPKLAVPQRQLIETLSSLLVNVKKLLDQASKGQDCLVRTRLFYKTREKSVFRQFPGMYIASGDLAKYTDNELDYFLTKDPQGINVSNSPPAFQAAFTRVPTEWSLSDHTHPQTDRRDLVAAAAAPILYNDSLAEDAIGMVALEIIAGHPDNNHSKAADLKPLLPEICKHVVSACVGVQKLFARMGYD
ncbi:MAG: Triacylglycerol esterase/lipase EstA, alpha/beta hydrolase fold [Polaromonas sp.]|nr:Triacylglycerol esterase/lipase EstA, alpha/beta hydrolase fold [Polaromonas sp.]